jgi:chromosome segregation ATPase
MVLAAGVSQLNTNANKRIHDLAEQIAKLEVDFDTARHDIVSLRDETGSIQEDKDHQIAVFRARLSDLEKARSQIRETLTRNEYQIELINQNIESAKVALQHRIEDQQADEQTLAKSKSDVKDLMAKSAELLNQLVALRKEFQSKYHANIGTLGSSR